MGLCRASVWVALGVASVACGGSPPPPEDTAEDAYALALAEKMTYGVGEACPNLQIYEGAGAPQPASQYAPNPPFLGCLHGSPTTFSSQEQQYFAAFQAALHAGTTRIIFDVSSLHPEYYAAAPGADTNTEIANTECFLRRWAYDARKAGLDPYVTMTAPPGYPYGAYEADVRALHHLFAGRVVHYGAINEPDLPWPEYGAPSKGRSFHPEEAADYWLYAALAIHDTCGKKCFVVAGEFSQVTANSVYVKRFMERVHKHLDYHRDIPKPRVWSMHGYVDMARGNTNQAEAYTALLTDSEFNDSRMWITECGAFLNGTNLDGSASAQEKAGRVFRSRFEQVPGVTRAIFYEVQAPAKSGDFDSAFIDPTGAPRPVFCAMTDSPIAMCPGSVWANGCHNGTCVPPQLGPASSIMAIDGNGACNVP